MKIEGTVLRSGEVFVNGTKIGENCKIDFSKVKQRNCFVFNNFDHSKPIGEVVNINQSDHSINAIMQLYDNCINYNLKWWKTVINSVVKFLGFNLIYKEKENIIEKLMKVGRVGLGIGGRVINQEGNIITEFGLTDVSIINNPVSNEYKVNIEIETK